MSGKAISESVFSSKEALGAVRLVALALRCADEINDDDRLVAASILREAHFTLEAEKAAVFLAHQIGRFYQRCEFYW